MNKNLGYWCGKKRPILTRKKISKTLKLKGIIPPSRKGIPAWNKGKVFKDLHGEKNPRWKGGTWNYYKKIIKERDNWTCQICGLQDKEIMEIDHAKPKSTYPELAHSIDNLITICPNCHRRKTNMEIKIRCIGIANKNRKKYV